MTDLGAWVVVAALICHGSVKVDHHWHQCTGQIEPYDPTTQFDQAGCMAEAQAINRRWHDAQIVGFATCRKVGDQ